MRRLKNNVFKKSKKNIKNKNKRRQTNKKYHRAVKKMYGGNYDTNNVFNFLDSAMFRGKSSIITFETMSGEKYNISKNPNKLLEICNSPDRLLIITDKVKINVADMTNQLSGMFFLYGTDKLIGTSVGVKRVFYGLFYLLNRIELLAILLKLKKNPRFSSIDVRFPIDENSRLPGDYNTFPHGYFYNWDQDHTNEKLSSFFAFLENIKQVETKLLMPMSAETDETLRLEFEPSAAVGEVSQKQQQIIDELEIPPPFFKMLRMKFSKITPDEPEEEGEEETPENAAYLRQLRKEKEEQKRQHIRWATDPDSNSKPLPNDRQVIAAIHFINSIIQEIIQKIKDIEGNSDLKSLPLPFVNKIKPLLKPLLIDVNGINIEDIKRIRKPILLYVNRYIDDTIKSQALTESLEFLILRYSPPQQRAGKKKI
jgi:hypothetical protein